FFSQHWQSPYSDSVYTPTYLQPQFSSLYQVPESFVKLYPSPKTPHSNSEPRYTLCRHHPSPAPPSPRSCKHLVISIRRRIVTLNQPMESPKPAIRLPYLSILLD